MLFQFGTDDPVLILLSVLIGTIIVTLVLYIVVRLIESEQRANDKIWMIVLIAFLTVFIVPIILSAIGLVFSQIGNLVAGIRDIIDGGGQNYLVAMVPIFGFLILLAINKFLLDISWESALWISLVLLFLLYLMFCILPELSRMFIPLQ